MKANKWIIAVVSAGVILGVLLIFGLAGREQPSQPDPTQSLAPTEENLGDTQAPTTDSARQPTQGEEETAPPTESEDLDDMAPEIETDPAQTQAPTESDDVQSPTGDTPNTSTSPTENENTGTGTEPDEEDPTQETGNGDFSFDFGDLFG